MQTYVQINFCNDQRYGRVVTALPLIYSVSFGMSARNTWSLEKCYSLSKHLCTVEYLYSVFQLITFYEAGVPNRDDTVYEKTGWTTNVAQATVAKTSRSRVDLAWLCSFTILG